MQKLLQRTPEIRRSSPDDTTILRAGETALFTATLSETSSLAEVLAVVAGAADAPGLDISGEHEGAIFEIVVRNLAPVFR